VIEASGFGCSTSPTAAMLPARPCRLRVTFAKTAPVQYCSHLDLARVWERALRRAGLPLVYSRGFNPRPRLQLAAALPLGHTGAAELLDVWLACPVAAAEARARLAGVLPAGLSADLVEEVPLEAPALQALIAAAEYVVTVEWDEPAAHVEARIARLLGLSELPLDQRGRRSDLRPLIEGLWLESALAGQVRLKMRLAARAGATARPEAVLEALGLGKAFARFHRERLVW